MSEAASVPAAAKFLAEGTMYTVQGRVVHGGLVDATACCTLAGERWANFQGLDSTGLYLDCLCEVSERQHDDLITSQGPNTYVVPEVRWHWARCVR